jgi:hypothetical protein
MASGSASREGRRGDWVDTASEWLPRRRQAVRPDTEEEPMFLFPPNVKRLHDQHDVRGLIRALNRSGTSNKAQQVRLDAAEYLAGYPYARVVEALMDVGSSGSPESWRALNSVRRILYPHHQENPELIAWWKSNKDTPDALSAILKSNRTMKRSREWDEVRRTIKDRIKAPARIDMLARSGSYGHNETSEEEQSEVHRWIKRRDDEVASELEAAHGELEAKWAADETIWVDEDAALKNWRP